MSPGIRAASNRTRPSATRRSWPAFAIGLIMIVAVGLLETAIGPTRDGPVRQAVVTDAERTALSAIPDLVNGGFYALQGDWGNAALATAAAVPFAGDVLGAGKLALKYGDDALAFVATKGGDVATISPASRPMRRRAP